MNSITLVLLPTTDNLVELQSIVESNLRIMADVTGIPFEFVFEGYVFTSGQSAAAPRMAMFSVSVNSTRKSFNTEGKGILYRDWLRVSSSEPCSKPKQRYLREKDGY